MTPKNPADFGALFLRAVGRAWKNASADDRTVLAVGALGIVGFLLAPDDVKATALKVIAASAPPKKDG